MVGQNYYRPDMLHHELEDGSGPSESHPREQQQPPALGDKTNHSTQPLPVGDRRDRSIADSSRPTGSNSPDVTEKYNDHVTPDEVFGPVSPDRSAIYNQKSEDADNISSAQDQAFSHTRESSRSPFRTSSTFMINPGESAETNWLKENPSSPDDSKPALDSGRSNLGDILASSSVKLTRGKLTNGRTRQSNLLEPQLGLHSRSSFNQDHIFDYRLQISDSKLDSALLRMFARNLSSDSQRYENTASGFSYTDFMGLEPVMWRVHPMETTHKEVLDREMDFIAFHVKPRQVVSQLYRQGILTPVDYNQLTRTEGQGDRAVTRLLLKTLQRRGSKAFPALVEALLANNYLLVCERLTESEQGLQSGLWADRAFSGDWRSSPMTHPLPPAYQTHGFKLSPGYLHPASPFQHTSPTSQPNPMRGSGSTFNAGTYQNQTVPPIDLDYMVSPGDFSGTEVQRFSRSQLDRTLHDLDTSVRLLHQDLASVRSVNRSQSPPMTKKKTEPARSSLRPRGRPQETPLDVQLLHLEHQQQIKELQRKLHELHDDVRHLRSAGGVTSRDPLTTDRSEVWLTDLDRGSSRTIDGHLLQTQLTALRTEILMLHDDVTALRFSRSLDKGSFRKSKFSSELQEEVGHRQRRPRQQLTGTDTDLSHLSGSFGPVTYSPFPTRYPSRYTPRDVTKPKDNELVRSMSRAENQISSPRERSRSDHVRHAARPSAHKTLTRKDNQRDTSAERSKSVTPDVLHRDKRKMDRLEYLNELDNADEQNHRKNDDHIAKSPTTSKLDGCDPKTQNHQRSQVSPTSLGRRTEKNLEDKSTPDERYTHSSASHNYVRGRNEDHLLDNRNKTNSELEIDQKEEQNNKREILQSVHQAHRSPTASPPVPKDKNKLQPSDNQTTESRLELPPAAYEKNCTKDVNTEPPRTCSRKNLPEEHNVTERENFLLDTNHQQSPLSSKTIDSSAKKHDALEQNQEAIEKTQYASENLPDVAPKSTQEGKSQEQKHEHSTSSSPNHVKGGEPERENRDDDHSRQKKTVRYKDIDEDQNDDHYKKINNTNVVRPKTGKTRPPNLVNKGKQPYDSVGVYKDLPSPVESSESDGREYFRVISPTNILSPHRVTTPYQILRNPNKKRITTWSKPTTRGKSSSANRQKQQPVAQVKH